MKASRWLDVFEGVGGLFGLLVRVGLVSGTAVAAVLGQFVLAILLGAVALGVFLRFWRHRRPRVD